MLVGKFEGLNYLQHMDHKFTTGAGYLKNYKHWEVSSYGIKEPVLKDVTCHALWQVAHRFSISPFA